MTDSPHRVPEEGGSEVGSPLLFSPYRLPGKRYAAVFEEGRSVACGSMVLRWVPNGLDISCLGVISAKKVFHLAVERSRARRLMREAFRLRRPELQTGFDLVLMGRRKLLSESCQEVQKDLLWLCKKAGLLGERRPHA